MIFPFLINFIDDDDDDKFAILTKQKMIKMKN